MTSPVDSQLCKELGKCIESLTHSGQKILDKKTLIKLKNICKLSDGYVQHAYHVLIYQLEKEHAEIRFSAFQICIELFKRSHCFRELLVTNLQHVMELTCGTSSDRPLPLPKTVAVNLKRLALRTIQDWDKEFGDGYKKLRLGYNFLKHCKKVDFNTLQMENSAEEARQQEQERRQNLINQEKVKKVIAEIAEMQPEVTSTLTTLENCIALLYPTPEDFFIQDENEADVETGVLERKHKVLDEKREDSVETDKSKRTDVGQNDLTKLSDSKDDVQNENSVINAPCKLTMDVVPNSENYTEGAEDDDESSNSSDSSEEEEDINFREYGMLSSKYSIEVNVNTDSKVIRETEDNAPIFENAKDSYIIIKNKFLPSVKNWIKIITKASESSDQLKKILDIKDSLEKAMKKYVELKQYTFSVTSSDSSDSDFEEVQMKDGYEHSVQEIVPVPGTSKETTVCGERKLSKREDPSVWNIQPEKDSEKDPTSFQCTLSTLKSRQPSEKSTIKNSSVIDSSSVKTNDLLEVPSSSSSSNAISKSEISRKEKLLAVAPKVPFDVDLYHWEDEVVATPTMVAVRAEGSRFWYTSLEELEEVPVPDGISGLRTRVIEFTGKFEPVRWTCRAPLPNGKLCPRRDRYKCPFHGPVVARDETGKCTKPEDVEQETKAQTEEVEERPDWQDPQLLDEIKQATGIDLKLPEKKKKKSKKKTSKKKTLKDKFPGLTDINAKQNTAYTRLSKKIFKKTTMKRVARSLDAADHKRFRDKYGDQFNYIYSTS